MGKQIEIKGYIVEDTEEGSISLKERKNDTFASNLAREIGSYLQDINTYEEQEDDFGNGIDTKTIIKNVQLQIYSTDKMTTLKEIKEKHLRKLIGDLDIEVDWVGYSEYTITGYDTVNFKIGNHNLEEIFKTYIGKYVIILIDVKGEANE